jgi:hypothetical protein|tara:strand:- start:1022 stop:1231 length:210 start_codon:yes stop_codon:yes gene_type:complete
MNKVKVKDSGSLYRDEESGAILNCSDSEYNNYLKLKQQKLKEVSEMDKLKDDVDELKDMMKLILSKLDK